MPRKKAEIILAYTAHSGSGVGVCEGGREGRLDLEWQQLVCLSEAAAASSCRSADPAVSTLACGNSVSMANHLAVPLSWGAADNVFTCCW